MYLSKSGKKDCVVCVDERWFSRARIDLLYNKWYDINKNCVKYQVMAARY